ncbi:hypothetical protein AALO_G00089630%2C partial [Xyrichtys novacula]|uniref:THAP-type domain-containing protein n=1 Tax=Xyrichtys novacula TaxID=13765 RepID=A0AAV1GA67_XYRNO|nr:hypothetical protein AALO_G00089630%2C partial [Xyrichtys novacula]
MYGFPKEKERQNRWIKQILRVSLQVHFEDSQFICTKKGRLRLKPDAVPTLFCHRQWPKRRRAPKWHTSSTEVHLSSNDHNYCTRNDFENEAEIEAEQIGVGSPQVDDGEVLEAPRDRQSGAASEEATVTGASVPGTSDDRATVDDLREQLRIETLQRKRAERTLKQQKKKNWGLRKKNSLIKKSSRGIRWSNQTLKAIQIRFTAGTTGYKTLQKMKIPLPDIRTTQRRMQHVKMEPGVLMEVFKMLKLKAGGMNKMERECVLTLDEMAITPGVELHMGPGRLFGNVTLPGHTGQATHACVFMLAGETTRWKQIVAYHYSGNSTDGSVYQPIIIAIVEAAASVGLHVINITSDMGSPNQAMWKSFGVTQDKPWIPHPVEQHKRLYFHILSRI